MGQLIVTVNYPDGQAADMRDTICASLNYEDNIDDGAGGTIPNPQSKLGFLREKGADLLSKWYNNHYNNQKQKEAISNAEIVTP